MRSIGALQPDAAAMFQEAFDEAVGVDKSEDLETIRRLLEPKLSVRGIPLNHMRWAFKVAHGIALSSIGRVTTNEEYWNMIEPHPREVIANHLALNFKMMYVSGETGEPSVETT